MSLFPSGSGGGLPSPARRRFIQGLAAAGAVSTLGLWPKPAWALRSPGQAEVLAGTEFDLRVGETPVNYHRPDAPGRHRQRQPAGANPALDARARP